MDMTTRLAIADWVGLLAAVAALAGLMLAMQGRTDNRLDRIEDKLGKDLSEVRTGLREVRTELHRLGERVARLEALAEIRPADAPAPGD